MIEKIATVGTLIDEGYYAAAYGILLHDIKPKLTGLKTDENGAPWGNGVFKHPWIKDPTLRSMLGNVIDTALADIKVCQKKTIHDALDSLGSHLTALGSLVDEQLSGCKKERCDRLFSNAETIYAAMVGGFQQNKTVDCMHVAEFYFIISRIDAVARNALIRQECNTIMDLLGNITRSESPGYITSSRCWFHHRGCDHNCSRRGAPAVSQLCDASKEKGLNIWCEKDPGDSPDNDVHPDSKGHVAASTDASTATGLGHHHSASEDIIVKYPHEGHSQWGCL